MRKIPTMFVRSPVNMSRVTREVTPGCEAAVCGELCATEKVDGTAILFKDGKWWKRHLLRPGKKSPPSFVPAQENVTETGKLPGWVPIGDGPEDKWHREGIASYNAEPADGCTFELVGPKVQKNPYGLTSHEVRPHGYRMIGREELSDRSFDGLRAYLSAYEIEGIVFWRAREPVCKIKRKDFALAWPVEEKEGKP